MPWCGCPAHVFYICDYMTTIYQQLGRLAALMEKDSGVASNVGSLFELGKDTWDDFKNKAPVKSHKVNPAYSLSEPGWPAQQETVDKINAASTRPADYGSQTPATSQKIHTADPTVKNPNISTSAGMKAFDLSKKTMSFLHGDKGRSAAATSSAEQGVPMNSPRATQATGQLWQEMQSGRELPEFRTWKDTPGHNAELGSMNIRSDEEGGSDPNAPGVTFMRRNMESETKSMGLNPLQIGMHETAHSRQSPLPNKGDAGLRDDQKDFKNEFGPSLHDIVNIADVKQRASGTPLSHEVKFPSYKKHPANWMLNQAKQHGVQSGERTMDEALATKPGQQWMKQVMTQQPTSSYYAPENPTWPMKPSPEEDAQVLGSLDPNSEEAASVREFLGQFRAQ